MNRTWLVSKIQDSNEIYGIAVDTIKGDIYYTTDNDTLFKIDAKQKMYKFQKDAWFRGIVWNGQHVLYICDAKHNQIVLFSTDYAQFFTFAGDGLLGHKDGYLTWAQFIDPWGITLDKQGDVYVTEMHHVRKISKKQVDSIAGSMFGHGRHEDGPAASAKLMVPVGIVIGESNGTIYVADSGNYCIRQINNMMVSTVGGIPGIKGTTDGPINEATFNKPVYLWLENEDTIMVCDSWSSLRKIDLKRGTVSSEKTNTETNWTCMCRGQKGAIYLGGSDGLYLVEKSWKWERYLWIGHLKEHSSYCVLARIPRELVKEISTYAH